MTDTAARLKAEIDFAAGMGCTMLGAPSVQLARQAIAEMEATAAQIAELQGRLARSIELNDDWHASEPLAYLVKNFDDAISEYVVFADERAAQHYAEEQEQRASDAGQPEDWEVYPLYACIPPLTTAHGTAAEER